MADQKGNRDLIKAINRSMILKIIKKHNLIPRVEIARITGLSAATVSGLTGELIQDGLVVERESGDSSGGRRPILLSINPEGGFVVGIKIMEDHLIGAITDLEATPIGRGSMPLKDTSPEAIALNIKEMIGQLLVDVSPNKLLGVGVGMAGIIDSMNGIVVMSPYFGWKNIPFSAMIEAQLSVPVIVDNDVNTLAFAEKWYGAGQEAKDFLLVTLGRGIGLGIMTNEKLYHGYNGGAGELGHTVAVPHGKLCTCGKRGCLEMYASDAALLAEAKGCFAAGTISIEPNSIEQISELFDLKNECITEILHQAGELLGQSIANLVNIFNPKLVIITGEGVRIGSGMLSPLRDAIFENVMPDLAKDLEILIETLNDDAWARGAASLILHELFESPVHSSRDIG